MNLKNVMAQEAVSVFLNTNEFAGSISIEDVPETPAICDWSQNPGGEHPYGNPDDAWGVNAVHAEITLAADVIPLPEPGQELTINGRNWIVQGAERQSGLLTLNLFRNVS